ncbi:MAG TPA: hypothetical protein VIM24_09580, partial [Candidatus Limnocylindrales bacterium]
MAGDGQAGGPPSLSSGVVGGALGGAYVEAGGADAGGAEGGGAEVVGPEDGGGAAGRLPEKFGIAGFSIWYSCQAPHAINPAPMAWRITATMLRPKTN